MKLAILLALACSLDAQINRPILGRMLDRDGSLHSVTGISGAFQLGPPALTGHVLASACSAELCLAKVEFAILSETSPIPAPPGPALLGVDGTVAIFYFPASNQFARWQNNALTVLDLTVGGEVLALRLHAPDINIAVRRDSEVWILDQSGTILDSLPRETASVQFLANAVAYSTPQELILRHSDGTERHFPVPGITALSALSDSYIQITTPATIYALRTIPGQENLSVLPHAPARPRRNP
jgi:hypothetical protein